MMKSTIWFVIVTYKPDEEILGRLKELLVGWPLIVIDNTEKNLGYGGGANRGMRKAFDAGARWVVVVNQDVTLARPGISKFASVIEHGKPGIVGPESGELDGKRWTTILPGDNKIDYISGAIMAIHRDVYERIGGFYEPYFLYYEDADLCIRAQKAGFALKQVAIEGFGHTPHGNEYYLARNHLLFVLRNAPLSVKLYEFLRLPKTLLELWL